MGFFFCLFVLVLAVRLPLFVVCDSMRFFNLRGFKDFLVWFRDFKDCLGCSGILLGFLDVWKVILGVSRDSEIYLCDFWSF